ncbi:helix-turn-helix domain-containing protein [Vibrio comitans]|uniref:Transcriptional regulator n=1 Tax=Vibrio comitans NBRC 102076 TaxID=1219078 RepID=A0A4Y3IRI2_9VIBR|nr:helix-turn-helix transcriptional regulator [Vibrio comitans]GEA62159.1 transcriptional regulator [Vibrio comitans NBRC 102076]
MNKQNFHERLRYLRVEAGLSQGELANQLSEQHRVFANVTQSMISLWEHGKVTPSILRRVGLAHFFYVDYEYAPAELPLINRAKSNQMLIEKQNTFFDYPVTDEVAVKYSRLTDYQRDWVQSSHSHILQDSISLDELMNLLNVSDPWVRIFYHQGAIVSAYVYEKSDNKLTIVSLSAINLFIWKHVHEYIATLPSGTIFKAPVHEASLSLLFRDLYIEPEILFENGAIYETTIGHLYHNAFVRNMLDNDAYDFRLLRYELNKSEEAQILNEAI